MPPRRAARSEIRKYAKTPNTNTNTNTLPAAAAAADNIERTQKKSRMKVQNIVQEEKEFMLLLLLFMMIHSKQYSLQSAHHKMNKKQCTVCRLHTWHKPHWTLHTVHIGHCILDTGHWRKAAKYVLYIMIHLLDWGHELIFLLTLHHCLAQALSQVFWTEKLFKWRQFSSF